MAGFALESRPLPSFGREIDFDLSQPLDDAQQQALRDLLYGNGLLVFRHQRLSDEDQTRVLGHFGRVLLEEGGHREISVDGNLGNCRLIFHSDLAFTPEPFKLLSLYGIDVDDGATSTLFASGSRAVGKLPPALRAQADAIEVATVIPPSQTERAVTYDTPDFLPQITGPAVIAHPVTGQPILNVFEMQTSRVEGLAPAQSEALLQELFGYLYAPDNVYEHVWHKGDLVIWDNLALQHGRHDQQATARRRLRRIAVADKTFFQLCPQFASDDPRILAWGSGEKLMVA
jgi:taurine dioxygenase